MKVILVSGSPRAKGNTEILLEYCKEILEKQGLKGEILRLSNKKINHCIGCNKCLNKQKCIQKDDFNELYNKVLYGEGLILVSPVYVGAPTSLMMAFIQRITMVSFNNNRTISGKIGGCISIGGETGQLASIKDMSQFYLVNGMILVGSEYWNVGVASKKGEIDSDDKVKNYVRKFITRLSEILLNTKENKDDN